MCSKSPLAPTVSSVSGLSRRVSPVHPTSPSHPRTRAPTFVVPATMSDRSNPLPSEDPRHREEVVATLIGASTGNCPSIAPIAKARQWALNPRITSTSRRSSSDLPHPAPSSSKSSATEDASSILPVDGTLGGLEDGSKRSYEVDSSGHRASYSGSHQIVPSPKMSFGTLRANSWRHNDQQRLDGSNDFLGVPGGNYVLPGVDTGPNRGSLAEDFPYAPPSRPTKGITVSRSGRERPRYDAPLSIPLRRPIRRLLEFTELPFLILWIFFSYWVTICAISVSETTTGMWLSALFAGVLVGTALNANAYKYIVKPKTRTRPVLVSSPIPEDSIFQRDVPADSPGAPREGGIGVFNLPLGDADAWAAEAARTAPLSPTELRRTGLTDFEQTRRPATAIPDSHLYKLVVRFPRFFNQLVQTQRYPPPNAISAHQHHLERQCGPEQTMCSIENSPMRATGRNHLSSGMNSLTKLAKDWSVFSDTLEWELDIPTMIRFFIIPFAVSALAGMTSDEEKYVLVFPKDTVPLTMALMIPTIVVIVLCITRLMLLYSIRVVWRPKVLFLNGCLVH